MTLSEEKSNQDINILVIDDEESIVHALVSALKEHGYPVAGSTDSLEGWQAAKTYKYQIVITDIKMPEMNGVELLQNIKGLGTIIQVVMITGYSSLEIVLECIKQGADDFLFKPFEDIQDIYHTVEACAKKIRRWRKVIGISGKTNMMDRSGII